MWYDIYDFSKKQLEVLRLLSRAVNEYESEGELCRQITNNLNKWIFEYSNWRKCQNTQIYYFDALVSISTNLCRTSVYFFINFCCWIPMLAVAHYELIWKWANVLKTLKLSLFLSSNLNLLSVISVISCNTMLSRKFLPDQCRAILTFFLRQAKKVWGRTVCFMLGRASMP